MTKSTPVQTPALKISPIASQPVRVTEEIKRNKKHEHCFIGILRLRLVRLSTSAPSLRYHLTTRPVLRTPLGVRLWELPDVDNNLNC